VLGVSHASKIKQNNDVSKICARFIKNNKTCIKNKLYLHHSMQDSTLIISVTCNPQHCQPHVTHAAVSRSKHHRCQISTSQTTTQYTPNFKTHLTHGQIRVYSCLHQVRGCALEITGEQRLQLDDEDIWLEPL